MKRTFYSYLFALLCLFTAVSLSGQAVAQGSCEKFGMKISYTNGKIFVSHPKIIQSTGATTFGKTVSHTYKPVHGRAENLEVFDVFENRNNATKLGDGFTGVTLFGFRYGDFVYFYKYNPYRESLTFEVKYFNPGKNLNNPRVFKRTDVIVIQWHDHLWNILELSGKKTRYCFFTGYYKPVSKTGEVE